jgi:hypothetical protein
MEGMTHWEYHDDLLLTLNHNCEIELYLEPLECLMDKDVLN